MQIVKSRILDIDVTNLFNKVDDDSDDITEGITKKFMTGEVFDAAEQTKLAGIAENAEVNVGEEYTVAEQSKVANLTADMLPMEIYDGTPVTPTEGDIAWIEGAIKRYDGAAWIVVSIVVEEEV